MSTAFILENDGEEVLEFTVSSNDKVLLAICCPRFYDWHNMPAQAIMGYVTVSLAFAIDNYNVHIGKNIVAGLTPFTRYGDINFVIATLARLERMLKFYPNARFSCIG